MERSAGKTSRDMRFPAGGAASRPQPCGGPEYAAGNCSQSHLRPRSAKQRNSADCDGIDERGQVSAFPFYEMFFPRLDDRLSYFSRMACGRASNYDIGWLTEKRRFIKRQERETLSCKSGSQGGEARRTGRRGESEAQRGALDCNPWNIV